MFFIYIKMIITILTSNIKTVYVDMDGTVLDSTHDHWYQSMVKTIGEPEAIKTYRKVTDVDNLKINMPLIMALQVLKAAGYELILWTNRGEAQRPMTEANLGEYNNLFSDSIYGAGEKKAYIQDAPGHIIDNETKNFEVGHITKWLVSGF